MMSNVEDALTVIAASSHGSAAEGTNDACVV